MYIKVYSTTLLWESSERDEIISKMEAQGWKRIEKKRKHLKITITFSKII